MRHTLQDILTELSFTDLPPAWQDHDLATFSSAKRLRDYQQEALQFALKALWKYYEDFRDFAADEGEGANEERKERLWQWYRDNGLEEDLDIPLKNQRRDVRALLEAYYPAEDEAIPYRHFINRMGFWMATGSGKSLILIKLIEILWRLMRRREIPPYPVLVLSARDDLLEQLRAHVEEFNGGYTDFRIHVEDLKAYPERLRIFLPLVGEHELTVFFYRADNLSDEQKERLLDFRSYENGGRWYVLLDEAHKGDKEDSKRQHIYSILSRNGFLFNFSATFTDPRDILTTVYNFNLSEFVRAGYGKHIAIFKQENRAFKDKEDYTGVEKQRVVLKALLMLAYTRMSQEALSPDLQAYHRPLMLTLVNSVNTQDADLKLFFRELERIGQGDVDRAVWEQAREELWAELAEGLEWLFEGKHFPADRSLFKEITPEALRRLVYNAPDPGEIEVLLRPSNRQEMAFKLKTADQPFALIKIGDISGWLKEELEGYEVIEGYEDEGFFRRLNEEDSPINILMGSRTFYEGWDSNRPNVITYINIGTGTEAKKFVLQSVGRGVRIEPLPGRRQRLLSLYNAKQVDEATFLALKDQAPVLETLFIFGTNRNALHRVIEQLDQEKRREAEHEIALEVNEEVVTGRLLLIPVYREAGYTILEERQPRRFEIAAEELERLRQYVNYLDDPRLLLCHHRALPGDIALLTRCLEHPEDYFNTQDVQRYGRLDLLLSRLFAYFKVLPQEVNGLKPLGDEIRHFRHIKVFLQDITELEAKITQVNEAPRRIADLRARYEACQLTFEEMLRQAQAIRSNESLTHNGQTLHIKRASRHYYVPVLLSESERIDWIRYVIRHQSEVRFLNALEQYLENADNVFNNLDWWAFSKIDEVLDEIYIPYYDPQSNRIRKFLPDFVFWLEKGNQYAIVFVDPKGTVHTSYQHKLDSYKQIFEDNRGEPKPFKYPLEAKVPVGAKKGCPPGSRSGIPCCEAKDEKDVRVYLRFYTTDTNQVPDEYRKYWIDHPERIPPLILEAVEKDPHV